MFSANIQSLIDSGGKDAAIQRAVAINQRIQTIQQQLNPKVEENINTQSFVDAELEKKRVMDEVKQEMVAIASLMAEKVVKGNIDTTIQDSLIDETLKEIGDATWQS